ncbi:MAG: glycosyltransferase family 2 protein [Pseudomonadota bacterium]
MVSNSASITSISEHVGGEDRAPKIALVIPCYRESEHVLGVLDSIPEDVATIFCVDDGCPDATGRLIEEENSDDRVRVIYHDQNKGVGAAMRSGYRAALAEGADIIVKIDGDGQMDPHDIDRFVQPLREGLADYTKGNRFFRLENTASMPRARLLGNIGLSFASKLSTGYWQCFDPNNGYTAIDSRVLALLPLDDIDDRFFFESDMLFRLNTLRAVVMDVPMQAKYGAEESSLSLRRAVPLFLFRHSVNFAKRIFYNYFLRGFSIASLEWIGGPLLMLFGLLFGIDRWAQSIEASVAATAGTVMLAALPLIIGTQMLLSAIQFDVANEPSNPISRLLPGR